LILDASHDPDDQEIEEERAEGHSTGAVHQLAAESSITSVARREELANSEDTACYGWSLQVDETMFGWCRMEIDRRCGWGGRDDVFVDTKERGWIDEWDQET
jgi:hypothetical protein